MPRFKAGESRNQMEKFPETINEYIPEGHLAKLVLLVGEENGFYVFDREISSQP